MRQVRAAPVVRVFASMPYLTAWMDKFDAACARAGLPLELALDEVHCAVILFHAAARPPDDELERLAAQAARQFHELHGPGVCGGAHPTTKTKGRP